MRALAVLAAAVLAAACSDDAPAECKVGDPTLPLELELLSRDSGDGITRLATPMSAVPLVFPEQGGWILLVGARVKNLDSCSLMLTTSIRDVCSDELMAVERRPVLLEASADGWAEPAADSRSQWGNLPVCPNPAATRDLQGQHYELHVVIETDDGRMAEQVIPVTPTCPVGDDTCLCQCQAGYDLGDECPGGLHPGTPAACPMP